MVVTGIAVVTAFIATLSGRTSPTAAADRAARGSDPPERGTLLRNILIGYTVVVALAAWRLGGPSGLKTGKGERPNPGGPLYLVILGLLVLGAVAVGVAVFLAGDSGARAVWGA